jgi:hypothetical protein
VWEFDPCGQTAGTAGCRVLRWSPVSAADGWDGVILLDNSLTLLLHLLSEDAEEIDNDLTQRYG